MIANSINVSIGELRFVFVDFLEQKFERFLDLFIAGFPIIILADALLALRIANDWSSSWTVVASEGKAPRQEGNRIFSDVNSSGLGNAVKPWCPFFISDSGWAKGDDFHILKFFGSPDVNKTDWGESSSKTNTGNDEFSSVNMCFKPTYHIISNGSPHVVILFLDLASRRSMLILDLKSPKNILPNVFGIGSVPKSENGVFIVDWEDWLDLYSLLLNHICIERFVSLITTNTAPIIRILLPANLQRVDQSDLLLVGDWEGEGNQKSYYE